MTQSTVSPPPNATPLKPHKRKRSRRIILILLLLIVGVAVLIPTILARVIQSNQGLSWVSGQPLGRIEVRKATIAWQGPVMLQDVVYNNEDGDAVATVNSVISPKSFWDYLTKPSDVLRLTFDGMTVIVPVGDPATLHASGESKLHEAINQVHQLQPPSFDGGLELTLTNAKLEFRRKDNQELIETWSGIQGHYQSSIPDTDFDKLSLTLPENPETQIGSLKIEAELKRDPDAPNSEVLNLKVASERMSLKVAQPWLTKYLGPEQPLQVATGNVLASLHRDPQTGWQLEGEAQVVDPNDEESEIRLALAGQFNKPEDQLRIEKFDLTSDLAKINVSGTISALHATQDLDIIGQFALHGAPLVDFLPAAIQDEIQIEGMTLKDLRIQGPMSPPADQPELGLNYSMLVGWTRAGAYGLASDGGQAEIRYQNQVVSGTPINVSLNGGSLLALPDLDLSGETPVIRFRHAEYLKNVELTEEVCRNWIAYISPTLAESTSTTGRFDLTLTDGHYRTDAPAESEIGGILTIREASVRPGPLTMALAENIIQIEKIVQRLKASDFSTSTLIDVPEDQIQFLLRDGRVYHDEFSMFVRQMRVTTSGSVGLDKTLSLQVAMFLPEKWFEKAGPLLQAMRGESVQIGVGGTTQDPQIDARSIGDFGKRIGVKAGAGLLEGLLNRRGR